MISDVYISDTQNRTKNSKTSDIRLKSCCCFDLRTGGLIICSFGILDAIGSLGLFGWIGALLSLISCGCLLYGILKNQPTFFRLYLFEQGIAIVLTLCGLIFKAIKSNAKKEFGEHFSGRVEENDIGTLYAISLAFALGYLAFKVYLLLVIYSLYEELRSKQHVDDPITLTAPPLQNVIAIDDNQMKFSYN